MAQVLKLEKYIAIQATIVCKTGMRIGGTETELGIGNAENPVIKNSEGKPYIPGSSFKGKLRSTIEYKYNRTNNGAPCGCGRELQECPVCTIFGPHKNTAHGLGPTRIIVRDAFLSKDSLDKWLKAKDEGKDFTETKTETSIDRRTGIAARGSLRTQERVEAGTEFELNISLRVFQGDDENRILEIIKEGIDFINKDYIGGSGTRGSGWVEITDLKIDGK